MFSVCLCPDPANRLASSLYAVSAPCSSCSESGIYVVCKPASFGHAQYQVNHAYTSMQFLSTLMRTWTSMQERQLQNHGPGLGLFEPISKYIKSGHHHMSFSG